MRRLLQRLRIALALMMTLGAGVHAQQGATARVTGIVWDSLRNIPLAGAEVSVRGSARRATSDSAGAFVLDSIPVGRRIIQAQHAFLDSIGLSGAAAVVDVKDGGGNVQISVPSFQRLWSAACGPAASSLNKSLVFGIVRDAATQRPVPVAKVNATWIQVQLGSSKAWHLDVDADSSGSYALCSVPNEVMLRVGASRAGSASGDVVIIVDTLLGVARQDLFISAPATGSIVGRVRNIDGRPIKDARVVLADSAESRTADDGAFRLLRVPAGTQQIEVLSLGSAPVLQVVNVSPNDTAFTEITMRKVPQLAAARVVASRAQTITVSQINERMKQGFGKFLDSTRMEKFTRTVNAFLEIPQVTVNASAGRKKQFAFPGNCLPALFIDRADQNLKRPDEMITALQFLNPDRIAMMEVYLHAVDVPFDFQSHTGVRDGCGAIVVTTKFAVP